MTATLRLTACFAVLGLWPSIGATQSPPAPVDSTAATLPPLRWPPSASPLRVGGSAASETTFVVAQLDTPPEIIQMPTPHPPGGFRGGSETVSMRYVVGANGKVEANSIQVISASNPVFVAPVMQALEQALFRAGQFHHQAVRTTVMQNFTFKGP